MVRFARIVTGLVTLTIVLWGGVLYMQSFMPWWIPVGVGCAVAIATASFGPRLWQLWLGVSSRWIQVLIHFVIAGGIGAFAVVGANYYGAPASSARDVKAVVVGKHIEKRDKYRTTRRNCRIKTGEYNVYYLDLVLPDSVATQRQVSLGEYNKAKKGGVYHLPMRDGLFGYQIIRR